jgi:RNA polymerase sigma factor (sigma-70 family)
VTESLVDLVAQARLGNASAWKSLLDRLKGVVWRATADVGLAFEDREDVFAATFFRLVEHLNNIREPEKLPGWLATTARNEVKQLRQTKRRLEPRSVIEPCVVTAAAGVDEGLLDGELLVALQSAFLRLGQPCQELLRLASAVPPLSYDEISELTGIARGSLGPKRQRCLDHLRHAPELRPFLEGARP